MANYCSNNVVCLGDTTVTAEIGQVFAQIESRHQCTRSYHLPGFCADNEGHMLDILVNEDWINYEICRK